MKKRILVCKNCLQRNYTFKASNWKPQANLAIKKFCQHCNKHTVHNESR